MRVKFPKVPRNIAADVGDSKMELQLDQVYELLMQEPRDDLRLTNHHFLHRSKTGHDEDTQVIYSTVAKAA